MNGKMNKLALYDNGYRERPPHGFAIFTFAILVIVFLAGNFSWFLIGKFKASHPIAQHDTIKFGSLRGGRIDTLREGD